MIVSRLFRRKYLGGQDVVDEFIERIIRGLEIVEFDTGEKPVLYFEGEERGLVLNRTNANAIMKEYGPDSDKWIGKRLVLFTMPVEFNGTTTNAIRVKIPKAPPATQPADVIPF